MHSPDYIMAKFLEITEDAEDHCGISVTEQPKNNRKFCNEKENDRIEADYLLRSRKSSIKIILRPDVTSPN